MTTFAEQLTRGREFEDANRRWFSADGWQFGFAIDLANLTTIGMDPSQTPGSRGRGAGAF